MFSAIGLILQAYATQELPPGHSRWAEYKASHMKVK